jgi:hypothetical protein
MDSRNNTVASDIGCIAARVALKQGSGEIQSCENFHRLSEIIVSYVLKTCQHLVIESNIG